MAWKVNYKTLFFSLIPLGEILKLMGLLSIGWLVDPFVRATFKLNSLSKLHISGWDLIKRCLEFYFIFSSNCKMSWNFKIEVTNWQYIIFYNIFETKWLGEEYRGMLVFLLMTTSILWRVVNWGLDCIDVIIFLSM